MLTITFYLGKPMSEISYKYLCHDTKPICANCKVPKIAVKEFIYRKMSLSDQIWHFPESITQNNNLHRLLHGLLPCVTV